MRHCHRKRATVKDGLVGGTVKIAEAPTRQPLLSAFTGLPTAHGVDPAHTCSQVYISDIEEKARTI
jgi:hypothetical protein